MYKIVVNPTNIIINDYTFGDAPQLENCFAVFNRATYVTTYNHIIYNSIQKQLIIPRGVDIPFLENIFGVKAFINSNYDPYRKNENPNLLRFKPKNEKQAEAIQFLLGQGQYSYARGASQLMLALNTGEGKTYLGIAYLAFMNMKSIIITASTDWLNQWKTRISEHSNITPREVCFIKGSTSIQSLMKKSKDELDKKYKVYLVTHSTLLSYANNNSWVMVRELFTHLGIGIKIFDEAHLNFENIANIDYNTAVYKTLYLTATPGRGDDNENNIFKLYFKNVPRIVLFDPESDPHTHYIAIRYKSNLGPNEISRCVSRYGFNKMIYCDQVILKDNFDYICRVLFDILSHMNGKILIFLATNNAVFYMYEWIRSNYPEYGNSVGIFTSINQDKKSALDCSIILTTSKSAGAAMDIPGLACTVQLAEPTKSEYQNKQRLGRTRGYNTYYIDIIDDSCSIIKKYYINNLPMYDKYALSTKEMRFTDRELQKQAFTIIKRRQDYGISPFLKL